MARDPSHPVWDLYDLIRTARLNVKYYSSRVSALQRKNFFIEIVLAVTTSGSAAAGLAFWSSDSGEVVWQTLLVVSAFVAVAKPLLALPDRIQCLEALVGDYRLVEHELKKIEIAVKQARGYGPDLQHKFDDVMNRMNDLLRKKGEYKVHKKLRARCQQEVSQELPAESFFVPDQQLATEGSYGF